MPPVAAASSLASEPPRLSGRTSPSRPSHAHLVTLPINNPTLTPAAQPGPASRSTLYGLPGVTTSSHSLTAPTAIAGPSSSPSTSSAAVESLAPHLASAEAHLGRMTLTAPDNMMRRRAQEKEKERKARKIVKKQERAREAMVALAGPSRSLPLLTPPAATVSRTSRSRPITPQDPGDSSSGGGAMRDTAARPSTRPSTERSTSANRPQDVAHAAQQTSSSTTSIVQTTLASSTANRRRPRAPRRPAPTRSNSGPAATDNARTSAEPPANAADIAGTSQSVRLFQAPRASLRRHDVYQEIARLGLPGAEAALSGEEGSPATWAPSGAAPPTIEAEASPPPFPEGSTRPESPPRAPPAQPEDYSWTQEDERIWTEYRRRVPDSPPPAFLSEQSDSESVEVSQQVVTDPTGRIHRLPEAADAVSSESDDSFEETPSLIAEDRRAWDEDIQRGLSFDQRFQRLEMRRRREDRLVEQELSAITATRADVAASPRDQNEVITPAPNERHEPPQGLRAVGMINPASPAAEASGGGRSVANTQPVTSPPTTEHAGLLMPARSTAPLPVPPMVVMPPHTGLNTDGALTHSSLPHQFASASNGRRGQAYTSRPRPKTVSASSSTKVPTTIRPRPISASDSRFRNDAAAAAERRRLAWGVASGRAMETVTAPARQSLSNSVPQTREASIGISHATSVQDAMPGAFDSVQQPEEESDASSSSEAEWAAEAAAFEALRRAAEGPVTARDSDQDSAYDASDADDPTILRSPMARLQDVLPKAPPPLALGRRRGGGLAYDASDSEDSLREDDESDSEDSPSDEDRDGVVRVVNPRWALPSPNSAEVDRARVLREINPQGLSQGDPNKSIRSKNAADSASTAQDPTGASSEQHRLSALPSPGFTSQPNLSTFQEGATREEPSSAPSASQKVSDAQTDRPLQRRSSAHSIDTTRSTSSLWQGRFPGAPLPPRKTEMTDRLRELFGAPLATPSPSALETESAHRTGAVENIEAPVLHPSNDAASVNRPRETAHSTAQLDEQQLRRDALQSIARLQESSAQNSSLGALERALVASLRPESAATALPSTARLSRQGAISSATRSSRVPPPVPPRSHVPLMTAANLSRSGSFINPRSSFAPLPRQTRLPTITDATRHFPPTREDSSSIAGDEEDGGGRGPVAQSERMAPVLPPRPPVTGNRVSALLARFEGTNDRNPHMYDTVSAHATTVTESAPAPPKASPRSISPLLIDLSADASVGPSLSRRRPPPPPPPAAPPRQSAPVPPRLDPAAAVTNDWGNDSTPGTFPRSISYPHLFRTDSQRDRARRVALDALTRNERREHSREAGETTSSSADSPGLVEHPEPNSSISNGTARQSIDGLRRRPLPLPPGQAGSAILYNSANNNDTGNMGTPADDDPVSPAQPEEARVAPTSREPETIQRYITDLDVVASRLEANPSSSSNFDDIALIQDFLGPALPSSLTPAELSSIPLGIVEVEKRRVTKEGRVKTKLACLGLRVDRCGICLGQFREGQGAYVLGSCLHVFHGRPEAEGGQIVSNLPLPDCAREWFRRSRVCPMCRVPALEEDRVGG